MTTYGAMGAGAGGIVGAIQAAYNPISPAAARVVLVSHTAHLGGAAALFGGTQGILETTMGGPSLTNNMIAGAAAGATMGLKTKSFSGAVFGAGFFAFMQFAYGVGGESYNKDGFYNR